jgi:hypothetical protein
MNICQYGVVRFEYAHATSSEVANAQTALTSFQVPFLHAIFANQISDFCQATLTVINTTDYFSIHTSS